tara:strand:+ start:488 stop:733 length:246 start_codon:yes stop_codon:yes gene_type:complete
MDKPITVTQLSIPAKSMSGAYPPYEIPVDVTFAINPLDGKMSQYFKDESELLEFFQEITAYACYRINRDLSKGRKYKQRND